VAREIFWQYSRSLFECVVQNCAQLVQHTTATGRQHTWCCQNMTEHSTMHDGQHRSILLL